MYLRVVCIQKVPHGADGVVELEPREQSLVFPNQETHQESCNHRLNMELDLQSLFGLQLYSLTETPQIPSFPRNGAHIRGHYWSAKTDDISL
jgi:hypothetical protein